MTESNVLSSRALLAGLQISGWSARKLDKQITHEINDSHGAARDAGRYNKSLLATGALQSIVTISNKARGTHYDLTLPWLNDGSRILPAAAYDRYAKAMRELRNEFDAAVTEFVGNYPQFVEEARVRLNGMFKESDYPAARNIAAKFSFDVRILPVPDSRDFRVDIGDAQAAAIRADVEAATRNALESAMRDAWERIAELTGRMVERLAAYKPGEKGDRAQGIFRDSLVENVRELVAMLPAFNLTGDSRLSAIAARMDSELCQHTANELRESPELREATKAAAESILEDVRDFLG